MYCSVCSHVWSRKSSTPVSMRRGSDLGASGSFGSSLGGGTFSCDSRRFIEGSLPFVMDWPPPALFLARAFRAACEAITADCPARHAGISR